MAPNTTHFAGDQAEANALVAAIAHYCQGAPAPTNDQGQRCGFDADGKRIFSCAAHQAMLDDQRFLDGLLWERHNASRLWAEEFKPSTPEVQLLPYRGLLHGQCGCGCGRSS